MKRPENGIIKIFGYQSLVKTVKADVQKTLSNVDDNAEKTKSEFKFKDLSDEDINNSISAFKTTLSIMLLFLAYALYALFNARTPISILYTTLFIAILSLVYVKYAYALHAYKRRKQPTLKTFLLRVKDDPKILLPW